MYEPIVGPPITYMVTFFYVYMIFWNTQSIRNHYSRLFQSSIKYHASGMTQFAEGIYLPVFKQSRSFFDSPIPSQFLNSAASRHFLVMCG